MKHFRLAFIVIVAFLLTFFISCSGTLAEYTGTITGKVVYSNHDDSTGIIVTLDKTSGTKVVARIDSIELQNVSESRTVTAMSALSSDGVFIFKGLENGTYTIYATSNISEEKAVSINVEVVDGKTVDAGELKLTATGSLKGSIIVDNTSSENDGFMVYISGTGFMAMTGSSGEYSISGIPAGNNYELVISKGEFSKTIDNVSIKANEETLIPQQNFTIKKIEEENVIIKKIEDVTEQVEPDTYDSIVYKNTYSKGAFKNCFEISSLNKKNVNLYYMDSEKKVKTYNADLYFPVNKATETEISDIPYVDFEYFYKYTYGKTINTDTSANKIIKYTLLDSYATFDVENQTIYFSNYDRFIQTGNTLMDISSLNGKYIQQTKQTVTRTGSPVLINLGSYGVSAYISNKKVYIPLQTFNDIFKINLLYNTTALYTTAEISGFYNGTDPHSRSEVLTDFNYKELCLRMDLQYGLKNIHDITSFDKFFNENGLKNDFYTSPASSMDALYKLTKNYLADYHTGVNSKSYYAGSGYSVSLTLSDSYLSLIDSIEYYSGLRKGILSFERGVQNYNEVKVDGKDEYTAYITFDSFNYLDKHTDYYALTNNGTKELNWSDVKDTFGLVIYANQQIKKNPKITKVVVDLSVNTGGACDALLYIDAWLQGKSEFVIRDAITGALESNCYLADTNMDGKFDDSDTLKNVKVYCITSPCSFSCGNALPVLLKTYNKATLIGKTTGGGSCIVGPGSTADSAGFQISSNYQMGYVKNGAFYQSDLGINPDFIINDYGNVYDRNKFNTYLENLK